MARRSINFAGRFEFLEAIQRVAPGVHKDLIDHVLPDYSELWLATSSLNKQADLIEWDRLSRLSGEEEGRVIAAVWEWPRGFFVRDEWIRAAAVQTMSAWVQQVLHENPHPLALKKALVRLRSQPDTLRWHYVPRDFPTRFFHLKAAWVPAFIRWAEFRNELGRQFPAKLKLYRREIELIWGVRKPSLVHHAEWAVRWQLGTSPTRIRHWHQRMHGTVVSEAAIQKAVQKFAAEIGLTLRPPKGGKRARKT